MSPLSGIGNAAGLRQIMALRQDIIDRSKLLQELHAPTANSQPPSLQQGELGSFTDALQSALGNVNAVQEKSRVLTEGYERGEVTDVARVMLARQEAGVAFEATLQVRNRLLSAYQEIMRMGV